MRSLRRENRWLPMLITALAVLVAPGSVWAASFIPLSDLAGGSGSFAFAISDDGTTVVGGSRGANGTESFRWTSDSGIQALPSIPGGDGGVALAVSADGRRIVGEGANAAGNPEAFVWTESSGETTGLGSIAPSTVSRAGGISGDGSIIVGDTFGGAFRSVGGGSLQNLSIGVSPRFDFAADISADGTTVVGIGSMGSRSEAAIWTEGEPVELLGVLPGGGTGSNALNVNVDGTVVVGRSSSSSGSQAFLWERSDGMVPLGDLDGGDFFSAAYDVSSDGTTVVGEGASENGREAFIWTQAGGMQSLQVLLVALGVDLTGWQLDAAYGISADGTRIAGFGVNPNGEGEAFLATIPEPGTAVLLGVGLGLLARGRSRAVVSRFPGSQVSKPA